MADAPEIEIHVREWRDRRGWSQDEVARRSGLSRAGVSAIETGRLVPSTAAALALAAAFGCRVEDLFRLAGEASEHEPSWAWAPGKSPCRYWLAEVGDQVRAYPVEATFQGMLTHDGIAHESGGPFRPREGVDPRRTLVLACCDPAAGLLAAEMSRSTGFRLLVFSRSSGQALELLRMGLAHAAGIHLASGTNPDGNAEAVRGRFDEDMELIQVARWEEGLALGGSVAAPTIESVLGGKLTWIGREPGSGARQCLDELLDGRAAPRRLAYDHRGVAEAIRCGWAEAGVCHRLAGEEAGLRFLGIRQERYDLCYPRRIDADPRIRALVEVVRSRSYRSLLAELPGYDVRGAGATERVQAG